MANSYPARTLDPARYAETFAVFVARSHEYPAMLDRLVQATKDLPDGFSCLDIGAGTGMVIRDWMARGGRQVGRYLAIEPIESHAVALRQVVAECGLDGEVIEEGFHEQFPIPGQHDFALFSHSLYWMPKPVACVQRAIESLRPGGLVVAFLQSPFGTHPMYRLFDPLLERDRPGGANHSFSSHELTLGLRAAGLNPRVSFDPTPIDLTGLFDSETERDDLISFCLQIEFGELAEPLKTDIVEYLRAACVEQDGRLHWYEPNATVTVRRPE